jgi:hypothetical protein
MDPLQDVREAIHEMQQQQQQQQQLLGAAGGQRLVLDPAAVAVVPAAVTAPASNGRDCGGLTNLATELQALVPAPEPATGKAVRVCGVDVDVVKLVRVVKSEALQLIERHEMFNSLAVAANRQDNKLKAVDMAKICVDYFGICKSRQSRSNQLLKVWQKIKKTDLKPTEFYHARIASGSTAASLKDDDAAVPTGVPLEEQTAEALAPQVQGCTQGPATAPGNAAAQAALTTFGLLLPGAQPTATPRNEPTTSTQAASLEQPAKEAPVTVARDALKALLNERAVVCASLAKLDVVIERKRKLVEQETLAEFGGLVAKMIKEYVSNSTS